MRIEIFQTDAPKTNIGSAYCGTTRALHHKYSENQQYGGDYLIDKKRVEEVCIYQQMYKRRFWSQNTLIRLLIEAICTIYCYLDGGGDLEDISRKQIEYLLGRLHSLQTSENSVLFLPVLRPIPIPTLQSKLDWLLERMIDDGKKGVWFFERDNTDANEFLQYYINFIKKMSNLPNSWFSWHNLQFPEHYEYPSVADRVDLGDFTLVMEE